MSRFVKHGPCPNCFSKDNLAIYEDHEHCFGCGYHTGGKLSMDIDSLQAKFEEYLHYNQPKKEDIKSRSVYIDPNSVTLDLPSVAVSWLRQYGITDREIQDLGFCYNKKTRRLVLPLFDKYQNLLVYQQRRIYDDDPIPMKYLTSGNVDGVLWTLKDLSAYEKQQTVVVVEDIVSAVVVGRLFPCSPLLGSNIPVKTLRSLYTGFDNLVIWLDPDKQKEAVKLSSQVLGLFSRVNVVLSDKDPKEMSMKQINEKLVDNIF